MRLRNILAWFAATCGAGWIATNTARAADMYPNRPVHWIVPYPPAGTTDILDAS
jgi:tripartite-type tricarboxylate transporter receptor subunit TctC